MSAVRLFHIFQRYLRKILKHIGLYDFFADRFYSVEDFDVYKKNESPDVYARLCQTIGVNPRECIFVDDSYSNLDFAKQCGMTTIRIYYGNNSAKDMPFIDSAYKGIEECIAGLKKITAVNPPNNIP